MRSLRPLLLVAVLLAPAALPVPAGARPADDGWQQASLIPVNLFAHPRRRGQIPHPGKRRVAAKPRPKATPKPTPRPTATPTPEPLEPDLTSTPLPSEAQGAMPTPDPITVPSPVVSPSTPPSPVVTSPSPAVASPSPAADDAGVPVVRPCLDVGVFWPQSPLGLAGSRPAPDLALTLWQQRWGLAVATTIFGDTYGASATMPVFRADTLLTDVQLRWRGVDDALDRDHPGMPERMRGEVALGYRSLGLADVNFGTLSAAAVLPVGVRDLVFRLQGLGGLAPGGVYCLDGRATLGVHAGVLKADLGVRGLVLGGIPRSLSTWGPTASLGLVF